MSDDNRPKRAARPVPRQQRSTKKRRIDINPEKQTILDREISEILTTSAVTRVATPSEPTSLEPQSVEDTVNLSSSKSQLACHSGIQAVTTPPSLSVDSSLLAGQSRTKYSRVSLPASSSASYTSGHHTPKTKASQQRKHKTRAATVRAGKQPVTEDASTAEDENSKSGYSTTAR